MLWLWILQKIKQWKGWSTSNITGGFKKRSRTSQDTGPRAKGKKLFSLMAGKLSDDSAFVLREKPKATREIINLISGQNPSRQMFSVGSWRLFSLWRIVWQFSNLFAWESFQDEQITLCWEFGMKWWTNAFATFGSSLKVHDDVLTFMFWSHPCRLERICRHVFRRQKVWLKRTLDLWNALFVCLSVFLSFCYNALKARSAPFLCLPFISVLATSNAFVLSCCRRCRS